MMWYGHNGGWSGWLAMSLMTLIFLGGLAGLAVWVLRSQRPRTTLRGADELLAERFARGEVDEDEFERRRELLHSGPHS